MTTTLQFSPDAAIYLSSGAWPQLVHRDGTNFPVAFLGYDAAATERGYWYFIASGYTSGNLTATVFWNSESATSGDVMWEVAIAAVTPGDAGSIEAESFGTAVNGTSTCLATTAKRLTSQTYTLTSGGLDSLAGGDYVCLRVSRLGGDGGDTMTGDANLELVTLSWT